MRIYKEIKTTNDWFKYLSENLWEGAKNRWVDMNTKQKNELCEYLQNNFENNWILSETNINDFVWFEWDEIKEKLEDE